MHVPPGNVPPLFSWTYDSNDLACRVHEPGASTSDDGLGSALDDDEDDPLIYYNVEELERDFEAWKADDEERKANEAAKKKAVQEEAVKTWKEQQVHEAEVRRQKNEDERSSLRAELTKQRIAPQQIEDIINHVHPQKQIDSDLGLFSRTAASDKTSSVASGESLGEATSSRLWSIWSRK